MPWAISVEVRALPSLNRVDQNVHSGKRGLRRRVAGRNAFSTKYFIKEPLTGGQLAGLLPAPPVAQGLLLMVVRLLETARRKNALKFRFFLHILHLLGYSSVCLKASRKPTFGDRS